MYYDLKYEKKLTDALKMYQDKWMQSLPDENELEHITFSEAFEAKMQRYFVGSAENSGEAKILRFTPSFRRITSLMVASVIFVMVAVFGVSALREGFFGFFYSAKSTTIYPVDDPSYDPDAKFAETFYAYIPSGFEETVNNRSEVFFHQEYDDNAGHYIKIHQSSISGGVLTLDTEGAEIERVDGFSGNAFHYKKKGETTLYWQSESSYYVMTSNMPVEEMIKVAKSSYSLQ